MIVKYELATSAEFVLKEGASSVLEIVIVQAEGGK